MDDRHALVRQLNDVKNYIEQHMSSAKPVSLSPLRALSMMVNAINSQGGELAISFADSADILITHSRQQFPKDIILPKTPGPRHAWAACSDSCGATAKIVALLACHTDRNDWLKVSQAILPNMRELADWFITSKEFLVQYEEAKQKAQGPENQTTTFIVHLVDVGCWKALLTLPYPRAHEVSENYLSFEHEFVIGVGPEGCTVWQSFVNPGGYTFDQYRSANGDRVRDWAQMDQFFEDLEYVVSASGLWKEGERNDNYERLFGADLQGGVRPHRPKGPYPNANGEAKLAVHRIEDMKLDNIAKFEWKIEE